MVVVVGYEVVGCWAMRSVDDYRLRCMLFLIVMWKEDEEAVSLFGRGSSLKSNCGDQKRIETVAEPESL